MNRLIVLTSLLVLAGCSGDTGTIDAAEESPHESWLKEYRRQLPGIELPSDAIPTAEQIDDLNDYYCEDSADDFPAYLEKVLYSYLPSGAFGEVSPSLMGIAAMVASAKATDCPGIAERDPIAEGLVDDGS